MRVVAVEAYPAAVLALVLGGGAVVAGAVGTILYVFDRPASDRFEVAPTAGGAALRVRGRF